MERFKKVAIKRHGEDMHDNLYEFEEPDFNRNDLDLSKVNVYLHRILNLAGIKTFRLRVNYGNIAEDGSFQAVEERFDDEEVFTDLTVNKFYEFEYLCGYNHLKIEIVDHQQGEGALVTCDLIIDLRELNSNRFIKKHY